MSEAGLTLPPALEHVDAAIVATRWHEELVGEMAERATYAIEQGSKDSQVEIYRCSGSFELPPSSRQVAEHAEPDAVIALGVLIRGETMHYQYLSDAVTSELNSLAVKLDIPLILGLLTCESRHQAERRASADQLDRGYAFGVALLQQVDLYRRVRE